MSGIWGVGEGTINGAETIVAEALRHMSHLLIGRDSQQIEDIWHLLSRQGYWRGGPIYAAVIAAIDMALWDIKGKQANLPVYQLLGGKARDGVMVYRHAHGRDPVEYEDSVRGYMEQGYKVIRAQVVDYGGATHRPRDVGQAARDGRDLHVALGLPAAPSEPMDRLHPGSPLYVGGITESRKIMAMAEQYNVRSAFHGASDFGPIAQAASVTVSTCHSQFPRSGMDHLPGSRLRAF